MPKQTVDVLALSGEDVRDGAYNSPENQTKTCEVLLDTTPQQVANHNIIFKPKARPTSKQEKVNQKKQVKTNKTFKNHNNLYFQKEEGIEEEKHSQSLQKPI